MIKKPSIDSAAVVTVFLLLFLFYFYKVTGITFNSFAYFLLNLTYLRIKSFIILKLPSPLSMELAMLSGPKGFTAFLGSPSTNGNQ